MHRFYSPAFNRIQIVSVQGAHLAAQWNHVGEDAFLYLRKLKLLYIKAPDALVAGCCKQPKATDQADRHEAYQPAFVTLTEIFLQGSVHFCLCLSHFLSYLSLSRSLGWRI